MFMSSKIQFLTKQCVEIVLSYISNEMNGLSESRVNILKGMPSGFEKNGHFEYCCSQGRPNYCCRAIGGGQLY